MSFLRSLLVSTPLIALSTIVMGSLSLVASLIDRTGRAPHRLARTWSWILLMASGIRVRTEGLEKLDRNATYVFVANHASLMDIPALTANLPFQFRFFAKKGLYRIPFVGGHLNRAGHIPVDRSSPRASLKSMSEGARIVARRGISVLLFPEGGRCPEGLREFKEGAAYIAIKAGVPVVPMALVGMRRLLPMGSIHIRSGDVILRIGDPIPTAGMGLHARTELNQRLYQEVAQLIEGGTPKLVG